MDRSQFKPPVKIALLEKKESEVSHCWKTCQLFSYVLVVISGIATSLSMGNIQKLFKGHCILYADLKVTLVDDYNIIDKPQHTASRWGSHSSCNFCQFCPVASVVFAGILGTLFIMCGRGGRSSRNLPQPWRIVPPAIMFNLIFVLTSCASVALTFGGFSAFCSSIGSQLNVSSCEDLIGYQWYQYPNATYFYDDIVIAETGATVGLVGWLMGFIILLIRVITHADFNVIPPVANKSMAAAAAIAATGTSQTPLGGSQTVSAISRSSAAAAASQRSNSTNDIVRDVCVPHRKRTMSTGSGGRNNNASVVDRNKAVEGVTPSSPIVINNHHHLHLHCSFPPTDEVSSIKGKRGKTITETDDEAATSSSPVPLSEITIVNEVEPLLPPSSLPKSPPSQSD